MPSGGKLPSGHGGYAAHSLGTRRQAMQDTTSREAVLAEIVERELDNFQVSLAVFG